ncbi:hypothetical protein AB5I41_04290 [Sphingomonas sp. MMS24-JH45]
MTRPRSILAFKQLFFCRCCLGGAAGADLGRAGRAVRGEPGRARAILGAGAAACGHRALQSRRLVSSQHARASRIGKWMAVAAAAVSALLLLFEMLALLQPGGQALPFKLLALVASALTVAAALPLLPTTMRRHGSAKTCSKRRKRREARVARHALGAVLVPGIAGAQALSCAVPRQRRSPAPDLPSKTSRFVACRSAATRSRSRGARNICRTNAPKPAGALPVRRRQSLRFRAARSVAPTAWARTRRDIAAPPGCCRARSSVARCARRHRSS